MRTLVPAGDHDVVLADVEACWSHDGDPLLYFRGDYHALGTSIGGRES